MTSTETQDFNFLFFFNFLVFRTLCGEVSRPLVAAFWLLTLVLLHAGRRGGLCSLPTAPPEAAAGGAALPAVRLIASYKKMTSATHMQRFQYDAIAKKRNAQLRTLNTTPGAVAAVTYVVPCTPPTLSARNPTPPPPSLAAMRSILCRPSVTSLDTSTLRALRTFKKMVKRMA